MFFPFQDEHELMLPSFTETRRTAFGFIFDQNFNQWCLDYVIQSWYHWIHIEIYFPTVYFLLNKCNILGIFFGYWEILKDMYALFMGTEGVGPYPEPHFSRQPCTHTGNCSCDLYEYSVHIEVCSKRHEGSQYLYLGD
jgi:hypothetical protein